MQDKKIKLSINTLFEDKFRSNNSPPNWNSRFEAVELSLADLARCITEGWAFSYQFTNNERNTGNFLATDFLAVDIDDGMTLEEAGQNPIITKYCSLLYTTPSHSPDRHRFRLVFVLPRTLTNVQEVRAAARALTNLLGGDPAATDGARIFYGSSQSVPIQMDGEITEELLAQLIEQGQLEPRSESINYSGTTANRATQLLDPDLVIKDSQGYQLSLKDVEGKRSIYCPFHKDDHASAFTNKNDKGSHYIHCATCQTTWWMRGNQPPTYDFDSFEKYAREVKEGRVTIVNPEEVPLAQILPPQSLQGNTIFITSNEYLSIPDLKDGLTLIKSPKGSGKTDYLKKLLQSLFRNYASLQEYEDANDFEDEVPLLGKDRILLIGHRQALIGNLCERLWLECYLDDSKYSPRDLKDRQNRYGVCLDSLWKVEDNRYDIIVIDEVEQVLNHFLSDTLGDSRYKTFRIFSKLIQKARKIVALDADLGWVTYRTLTLLTCDTRMLSHHERKTKLGEQHRVPVYLYINDWKPPKRSLQMYPTVNQLLEHMKRSVIEGKRVFVATNSKKKAKSLEQSFADLSKQMGRKINTIAITSDNSGDKDVQDFIKNIKTEIENYQVVISSPSLGTGVDITFKNKEQKIDCVYGIFENQINSHFEIDQQLARVRHPKEVHVWVSPQRFQFETDFGVVSDDYLRREFADVSEHGYLKTGKTSSADDIDPFYPMAAMLISLQRASKNNLRSNFISYKKSQNWEVILVEDDAEAIADGKSFLKIGQGLAADAAIDALLNAKTLNLIEYSTIKQRLDSNNREIELSQGDLAAFRRTNIERFYRAPIDRGAILRDDDGRLRQRVQLFEAIQEKPRFREREVFNQDGASLKTLKEIKHRLRLLPDPNAAAVLLYGLLSLTPIFENGKFDCTRIFTKDDLIAFATQCDQLKVYIEQQLKCKVRSDIHKKATQQLGDLLKLVGIEFDKSIKPKKLKGEKIYLYGISKTSLDQMQKIVSRRKMIEGWEFINQHYGFQYSDTELEEYT